MGKRARAILAPAAQMVSSDLRVCPSMLLADSPRRGFDVAGPTLFLAGMAAADGRLHLLMKDSGVLSLREKVSD